MSDLVITEYLRVKRGNRTVGEINEAASGYYVFDGDEDTWVLDLTASELRAIADKLDELNTQSQTAKERYEMTTLKQRLAELLPHFDDDLQLLPNKVLKGRPPQGDWKHSDNSSLPAVVRNMQQGMEYRIESEPKRPREVWVTFDRTGPLNVSNTIVPIRHGWELVRFIEDTPREVTDADVEYCWGYYMQMHEESAKQAFKRMLQHYEQERLK